MHVLGSKYHDQSLPPRVLYKYRSIEGALRIVDSNQVAWRCPLRFDDPLDVHWNIFADVFRPETLVKWRQTMREVLLGSATAPANAAKKHLALNAFKVRMFASLPPTLRRLAIDHAVGETMRIISGGATRFENDQVRVIRHNRAFCVSSDALSCLMWSLYADEHRGACVGLDSDALMRAWHTRPYRVSYSDNRPFLIDGDALFNATIFGCPMPKFDDYPAIDACFLTKHTRWAFLKEWRWMKDHFAHSRTDMDLLSIPAGSVTELVFGERATRESMLQVVNACRARGHSPEVYRVAVDEVSADLRKLRVDVAA